MVRSEHEILLRALKIARREGCDLTDLAGFVEWHRDMDEAHLAACTDPECEWIVCRRARGLNPLKLQQEIAKIRERHAPGAQAVEC